MIMRWIWRNVGGLISPSKFCELITLLIFPELWYSALVCDWRAEREVGYAERPPPEDAEFSSGSLLCSIAFAA